MRFILEKYPIFHPSDLFFATQLLGKQGKENSLIFLSYLFAAARDGHLCLEVEKNSLSPLISQEFSELKEKICAGAKELPEDLCQIITIREEEAVKPIIRWKNLYYLQKNWIFEEKGYHYLDSSLSKKGRLPIDKDSFISLAERYAKENTISFQQKEALIQCVDKPLFFLLGGPGTGKTHLASYFARLCLETKRKETFSIAFLAPTGKALANLKKRISLEKEQATFSTIHSYLSLKSFKKRGFPRKNEQYDLIIVDEASMLDARMIAFLFSSLSEKSHLLFLGDPHQLPPIEQGTLLQDISLCFPELCWQIKENFRSQSKIQTLSDSILKDGDEIFSSEVFHPLEKNLWEEFLLETVRQFTWEYPSRPDICSLLSKAKESILLTPVKKGVFGADFLNQWIGKTIMKKSKIECWRAVPILIRKNNPEINLYNGMEGVMLIAPFHGLFHPNNQIFFDQERAYSLAALQDFSLNFVLSVHKSQGSEYEKVTLILPKGTEYFGKELIYTGVTRAKKRLSILGDESTLFHTLKRSMKKKSGYSSKRGS